ncbi:hypothetical protein E2K93_15825 [Thalassotalea sp. HSM 43]|uniref:hypothetical protein n=1 Tax=Thalassotalea sp. HSM 43 TaxID=2552945 RepID=UPI0010808E23|nr:hypothetical protein [Thalassotalea sp. HSM 43]QBY05738.1 hypothetical protein E2K93_15825 [Thalassotalea sp. HSM 43]
MKMNRMMLKGYRYLATLLVLTPLMVDILLVNNMVYSILYLPLISLLLAIVGKYIDLQFMIAILNDEKRHQLGKVSKVIPMKSRSAIEKKVA